MGLLCLISLYLLLTGFQARYRTKPAPKKKSKGRMEQDEVANSMTFLGITVYNAALLGCMLLNVSTKGSIGSFETMGISFAETHFGLEPAVAGLVVSICGMIGVCFLLSMGWIGRILTDIQMIIGGITVCAVGIISFAQLKSVEMGAENSIVHYIIGIFMIYGIGYPIGHTAVIGLFSKGKSNRAFFVFPTASCDDTFETKQHIHDYRHSRWKETAGNIARMVCLCRIFGKNLLPSNVGLHF